ncbi:TRAP-type C4-dicarboxylate transport system, small permease component [Salipaludibacillus aurantiacus]|uniref:TRAP-type C4-dicarboxylate transport system, small permease component n=2 Tax=Salipaludibacillus aurantiacus TaxID=1601833 RepID=A0A1H9W2R4_9BACI|nr:TRAP-type C4-dicarboxylate transport system, small permease component [Salipaludibacillus aurantiacus]
MKNVIKMFGYLETIIKVTIACIALVMFVLVFLNVVLRYLFSSGITWSSEVARYLLIWLIFLGAVLAFKENAHLNVDVLFKKFNQKTKKVVYILSSFLMLFVILMIFDGSLKTAITNINSYSPAAGVPMWIVHSAGVAGSLGMGTLILYNLYKILIKKEDLDKVIARDLSDD